MASLLTPLQEKVLKDLLDFIPHQNHEGKYLDEVTRRLQRVWKPSLLESLLDELTAKRVIRQVDGRGGGEGTKVFIIREAVPYHILTGGGSSGGSGAPAAPHHTSTTYGGGGEYPRHHQQYQQTPHHHHVAAAHEIIPTLGQLEQCVPTPHIRKLIRDLVYTSPRLQRDNLTFKERALLESLIFLMSCARESPEADTQHPLSSLKINKVDALKAVESVYLEDMIRHNPFANEEDKNELFREGNTRSKALGIMRKLFDLLVEKKYFWCTARPGASEQQGSFFKIDGDFGKSMDHRMQLELLSLTRDMLAIRKPTAGGSGGDRYSSHHHHHHHTASRTIGTRRSRSAESQSQYQYQPHQHQHQNNQYEFQQPPPTQHQEQPQQQYQFYAPPPPPVAPAVESSGYTFMAPPPPPPQQQPPAPQQQQQQQKFQGPPGSQILFDSNGIPTMMILADGTSVKLHTSSASAAAVGQNHNNNNHSSSQSSQSAREESQQHHQHQQNNNNTSDNTNSMMNNNRPFVITQRDPRASILYPPPIYIFMGEPLQRPLTSKILLCPPPMLLKRF